MADYINISSDTRHGAAMRQAVNYQQETLERLRSLKATFDEMVDGADYSVIETQLGLQAGEGELVYNLHAGALAAVDVAAVTQFLARGRGRCHPTPPRLSPSRCPRSPAVCLQITRAMRLFLPTL